eukprot:3934245-Rhodomonas_salina.2
MQHGVCVGAGECERASDIEVVCDCGRACVRAVSSHRSVVAARELASELGREHGGGGGEVDKQTETGRAGGEKENERAWNVEGRQRERKRQKETSMAREEDRDRGERER